MNPPEAAACLRCKEGRLWGKFGLRHHDQGEYPCFGSNPTAQFAADQIWVPELPASGVSSPAPHSSDEDGVGKSQRGNARFARLRQVFLGDLASLVVAN
jgi:hypothetical protein